MMDSFRQLGHVCPSVRMEQLCSHWTDFNEIWYLNIFRKSAQKIQMSLKSANNNRYFTWRPTYIFLLRLAQTLLWMKNVCYPKIYRLTL
jgi:hypothetical protein